MNRRSFMIACAGLLGSGAAAPAAENDWILLGTRNVNWALDSDIIPVGPSFGKVDHLQLRVRGNGLFVEDMDVVYGVGGHDDIPLRFHIPQGGSTRAIDLRGANRFIRHVRIVYRKPVDGGGPTFVELWGQR